MPFAHESIAALPVSANADAALIRAMATRRIAYCLASTELASDFTATDPDTGVRPLYLVKSAVLYQLDAADSTTAAGATCLVTADGLRYKSDSVNAPWSVLDKDTTAQPASPTVGDRYLVPVAATGAAWSGKDNQVAEYTAAGWFFSTIAIGRPVYVRDEDAFYYRNNAGTWTSGFGAFLIPAGSIAPSKMLWDGRVQNQTTNTPPSAAQGVAYIIGSVPTGAWSGNAGKVAIRETPGTNSTFEIYPPNQGMEVFDISLNWRVRWNGTGWISAAGAWQQVASAFTVSGTSSLQGVDSYAWSATTAPTTSKRHRRDDVGLTFSALLAGTRRLRFRYSADIQLNNLPDPSVPITPTGAFGIMLLRDSETNAIAWCQMPIPASVIRASNPLSTSNREGFHIEIEFLVDVPDASSHVYKIALIGANASSGPNWFDFNDPTRRLFTVEEAS